VPSYVTTPRNLSDLSALRYRFATARSEASARDDLLVVTFVGTYGMGSAGNGDAVFMRAVLALALRAFAPAGVVLDLRDLDYRWGDMMGAVLNDATIRNVPPSVVISDLCRKAMTSLVTTELGEDPADWLFGSPGDAIHAVDNRVQRALAEVRQQIRAAQRSADRP
jgi:hypothetical protein